jgi:hypothetical protein
MTACLDGALRWWAVDAASVREAVARVAFPDSTTAEQSRSDIAPYIR